jgi:ABC-type polysaccharide/polyol phosphate transport system ATPase subunit
MISKLPEIIEFSELGSFIQEPVRTYSSGMKARLGLAVASAIHPDILLIDEVLGVGDPQFKEKSKQRILDLVTSTKTVVLVSHSFGLMQEICDRLVFIHKGKIEGVGDPEEIIQLYYKVTGK